MKKEELTSREKRRRRRIRSQVIAYVVLGLSIILVGVGIFFGIRAAMKGIKSYNQGVSDALAEAESKAAQENEALEMSSEAVTQEGTEEEVTQQEQMAETENVPLDELVSALLAEMTLEEKVAGMFVVTPEAITGVGKVVQAGEGTKKALEENPVGGMIYTERNYKSDEQFLEMLTNSRAYAKYPMFLAVWQECGASGKFGVFETAKASELTGADAVKEAYGQIADKLAGYGINMNIAPVADVVSEEGNPSLQGRTFGSDATTAAPLVKSAVEAMQDKEVSAVLTKFPGEGSIDTTQGMKITKSLEELKNSEFLTYQMAIENGVDCIMVSHATAPEVTGDETPCSLSNVVIQDILRTTLGFEGVVMTDMLNDKNITKKYSDAEAAVAAVLAGADVLLMPNDYFKAYEGIMKAIEEGTITEERIQESLVRIYRLKYKHALDEVE
ncbi:MAG: beta-N-acetylhexosaminidase [Lachnospiraceae bacterium]|nr:beta-N-acetylhexosaminidase [Lachnospiraceae bacterium]